jgi:hypothetical protein
MESRSSIVLSLGFRCAPRKRKIFGNPKKRGFRFSLPLGREEFNHDEPKVRGHKPNELVALKCQPGRNINRKGEEGEEGHPKTARESVLRGICGTVGTQQGTQERVEKIQTTQWEPHKRLLYGMKDEGA